ncbi:alpha/beta fold hydrolase [Rhizobium sp. CRIBSB]|nr:alpha/beta fold hydrolase [Rhizobium sp. CRIBSB]
MKPVVLTAALLSLIAAPVAAQEHAHAEHGAAQAEQGSDHAEHGDHHADFESGRMHVRIDGPQGAPDIIMIPGLSSSPHVFDTLTAELSGRYRIHRIHVQGFAGAPAMDNAEGPVAAPVAEEIARYIAEKGLNRPVVIGHSMGGTIGMMLAARHPEAVSKLMVVDMIPFVGAMYGAPGITAEQVTPTADMIYAGMTAAPEAQYQAQVAASVQGMIFTESLRAGPLQDAARSDRAVSSSAFRELIVTDLRPELSKITAPVTVLYVKFNDASMTNEVTDMLYRLSFATLPGATLKRIEDSAHFIMLDQPVRFAAEVNAFLE